MDQEDAEVFEITDFTTASDWEIFISSLEEVINEWRLPGISCLRQLDENEISRQDFDKKIEKIKYSDFEFTVTFHYLPGDIEEDNETAADISSNDDSSKNWPYTFYDLLSTKNDFPSKSHCLSRWYGLRNFVTIAASSGQAITGENRVKLLMSSVAIALSNTACLVPVLVQIDKPERQMYSGVCQSGGLRVDFEMAHLRRVPFQYRNLPGLLELFHGKINSPHTLFPNVDVSARWTYRIYGWPDSLCVSQILGPSEDSGMDRLFGFCLGVADEDPIEEFYISTTWAKVPHHALTENAASSRMSPLGAPHWAIRLSYINKPNCLLAGSLRQFIKLCRRRETVDQLLSAQLLTGEEDEDAPKLGTALNRLTEPAVASPLAGWGQAVRRASSRLRTRRENAPLDDALLNQLLWFLFPDAASENPIKKDPILEGSQEHSRLQKRLKLAEVLSRQLKAAPVNSLTHRLALCLCLVHQHAGGVHAVAHLWQEVILELRYRWDRSIPLAPADVHPLSEGKGVDLLSQPDLGACRLHQKFQMLACCMKRRQTRADTQRERDSRELADESEEVEEDEFFECEESPRASADDDHDEEMETDVNVPGEGRLKPCEDLCLLRYPDRRLYVPMTQDPAPVTEDQLDERAALMTSLGTDSQGAQLRARLQCAALASDMEAFKAANPGCTLEDFVRWYSPRDFIPEPVVSKQDDEMDVEVATKMEVVSSAPEVEHEGKKAALLGCLSQRMQVPGNIWKETWQSARSVPARLQKRLFDDTKEAEKVMQYLSSLKPGEVAQHLLPCVFLEALLTLDEAEDPIIIDFKSTLTTLTDIAARTSRSPIQSVEHHSINNSVCDVTLLSAYEELLRRIGRAEFSFTAANSLKHKLYKGWEASHLSQSDWSEDILPCLMELLGDQLELSLPGAGKGPFAGALHLLINECRRPDSRPSPGNDADMSTAETSSPQRQLHLPDPAGQEFILRAETSRPASSSRSGPQRLFCSLTPDEYRFVGAFTSDTTFT